MNPSSLPTTLDFLGPLHLGSELIQIHLECRQVGDLATGWAARGGNTSYIGMIRSNEDASPKEIGDFDSKGGGVVGEEKGSV